jgi:hypothetical protein
MEPALRDRSEDPESKRQLQYAGRMRDFLKNVKYMRGLEGVEAQVMNQKALNFQMWYMKGQMPDGSGVFEAHQKSLQLRPFEDMRSRSVARADDPPGS